MLSDSELLVSSGLSKLKEGRIAVPVGKPMQGSCYVATPQTVWLQFCVKVHC